MINEIDKRNLSAFESTTERENHFMEFAKAKSIDLLGGQIESRPEINLWTGNLRAIKTEQPIFLEGNLIERALGYLQEQKESFGFESGTVAEYFPDPNIAETSTGLKIVNAYQYYKGIPVFLINRAVIFNSEGGLESAVGDSVTISETINIRPEVTAGKAMAVVADYLKTDKSEDDTDWLGGPIESTFDPSADFVPKKIIEFPQLTCLPTVLDKSIFADYIRANLVIFYIGPTAELSWKFTVTVDEEGLQYEAVVSASNNEHIEILYLKKISLHADAVGYVHKKNGGYPKEEVTFPLTRNDYPFAGNGTSVTFKEWVTSSETKGTNVIAFQSDGLNHVKGIVDGMNKVVFNTSDEKEQQTLNIFYFCNYLHDFFYLLGFDSKAGSFDDDDPVIAKAFSGPISGTATMSTPIDGSSPVMRMGLAASGRHTALDADVVFHEYVHGVTTRLVGGKMNDGSLREPQSQAMGEGWSDYFALSIQNYYSTDEKNITGDWVTNKAGGIRKHVYNDDYDQFLTYGKIDKISGPHNRGELWCATLMHWTRHLSRSIGKDKSYYICWQSVVDGLKLTNANPSFIDARNAIFRALQSMQDDHLVTAADRTEAIRQFWSSFAKFGMGVRASSPGPSMFNLIENFDAL
ncbi:M36 family metallopeptidase [Flavobacterium sp. FlaQc-48]|uniref:M36 family metallopeptidase n=1 Tax=Flavobacterium sp. FlaQc-48 TaxID=3374181 RepID=UPI0037578F97